ncbi:hypothetical protein ACFLIM_41420 [Nonomuraea sp. M3C6]|uniref:Uncharacterized protein n=1 Tax=Nonomuraea marmarensis TaxID=3351344 RepID=A0ABW7AQI4_9ACTN
MHHESDRYPGRAQFPRAELEAARRDLNTAYQYAGQTVGLVRHQRTAADVVRDFAAADQLLSRFGSP